MHPFMTMLEWESGAAVFTELGFLRSITPFDFQAEFGESTHLKSADAWKVFNRGWKDPGELPFVLLYDDDAFDDVFTLMKKNPNEALDNFRLTLPQLAGQTAPAKLAVAGILRQLTSSEGAFNTNDPYTIACAIKRSGAPTFTPATTV